MTYKISELNKSEVERLITEKCNAEDTIERNLNNTRFKLKRITLPIEKIYYNIKNVRTSKQSKEYIKKRNLDSNYFDQGEYHNIEVQNSYHSIIYKEVLDHKKSEYDTKFKINQESQTEEIYINLDGIAINGNSRVSYWREHQTFKTIDCLVFCEQYSWMDLMAAVNHIDSDVKILQEYAWYNRADQARDFLALDNSTQYVKKVATDCAYSSEKKMMEAISELEIAEEFLDIGYENRSEFSDLQDSGSGGGSNYYAFMNIAKGIRALDKLRFEPTTKLRVEFELKKRSFELIDKPPKGEGSVHSQLEELWKEVNLKSRCKEIEEEALIPNDEDGLLSESDKNPDTENDETPDDKFEIKPTSDVDDNKKFLEEQERKKRARMDAMDAAAPAKRVNDLALSLQSVIENITKNTDIKALQKAYKNLLTVVEENKKKVL